MILLIAILLLLACAACGDLPASPSLPSTPVAVTPLPALARPAGPIVFPQDFPIPPGLRLEPVK